MPTDLFMPGFEDFQRTKIEMECMRKCLSTMWDIGQRWLKGQCHEMNIFFLESFNLLICTFLWVSTSFKSFSVPNAIIIFLFASLKLPVLTHGKLSGFESRHPSKNPKRAT